jgi:hypothetical protein
LRTQVAGRHKAVWVSRIDVRLGFGRLERGREMPLWLTPIMPIYDANSATVPLLRPSAGSGHPGSAQGRHNLAPERSVNTSRLYFGKTNPSCAAQRPTDKQLQFVQSLECK